MRDIELHEHETTEDTERHLNEHRRKFESDCLVLLKIMLKGKRLTTQEVRDMKIDDRRLRNLHEVGKCQREWAMKPNGSRSHVEYFVQIPSPITKTQLIKQTSEAMDKLKTIESNLVVVFSLPDDEKEKPRYVHQTLF